MPELMMTKVTDGYIWLLFLAQTPFNYVLAENIYFLQLLPEIVQYTCRHPQVMSITGVLTVDMYRDWIHENVSWHKKSFHL